MKYGAVVRAQTYLTHEAFRYVAEHLSQYVDVVEAPITVEIRIAADEEQVNGVLIIRDGLGRTILKTKGE